MKLNDLRKEINEIDEKMLDLFEKRMAVASQIGQYKRKHQLPVLDKVREDALLNTMIGKISDPSLKTYYENFLKHLMDLSKAYQHEN